MVKDRHISLSIVKLCLVLSVLSGGGCAPQGTRPQQPAPAAAKPAARPEAPAEAPRRLELQPQALERLRQMSETLAKSQRLSFNSRSSVEVLGASGQFLTFFTESRVVLQRPNKFRLEITGDLADYRVIYTGREVFGIDPEKKLYAITAAPETIDETLQFLTERYGIHFHAADFMARDPYTVLTRGLNSARLVGPARIEGRVYDHIACMGPGIHWEIWLEPGARALPRRLAVTYTDVPNFPRFMVDLWNWNLRPALGGREFRVEKPAGAREIDFGQAARQQGAGEPRPNRAEPR